MLLLTGSLCEAGHYCVAATSRDKMLNDFRCAAGIWCDAGVNVVPSKASHPCPFGKYCVEATPTPVNCRAGTFNPTLGIGSLAECTICPAGAYCLEGSHNITGYCDPGYYCEAGSDGPFPRPCPGGKVYSIFTICLFY